MTSIFVEWKSPAALRRNAPASSPHSAPAVAPDDFTADGLTKVMSVLPPGEARQFMAREPEAAVRIVRKPGAKVEVYEFNGFRRHYK